MRSRNHTTLTVNIKRTRNRNHCGLVGRTRNNTVNVFRSYMYIVQSSCKRTSIPRAFTSYERTLSSAGPLRLVRDGVLFAEKVRPPRSVAAIRCRGKFGRGGRALPANHELNHRGRVPFPVATRVFGSGSGCFCAREIFEV